MRVVVTGADGFVGRHLTASLRARGDEVLALDGPSPSSPHGVDVLDQARLGRVLAEFGPEGIINLAGISSVARSHAEPVEAFRVNALGVVTVCATLREVAPRARLLLIGSGEVYGPVPVGARANENDSLAPTSPYAAAKASAEVAALTFHRAYGLDVVCVRPFNHLGRGQHPSFAIPSFARQIEGIRRSGAAGVVSVGNLEAIRDFSHVDDVVEAYRLLVERGVAGEVYNVCSGEARSVRSVLDEMIEVAKADARIQIDPARVRPVDIASLVGDDAKLRALGWSRKRTLRRALEDVLAEASASLDAS